MKKIHLILIFALLFFTFSVQAQDELFKKGVQQYEAKQYDQAIETFKQVVNQSPKNHAAFYNLGLSYYYSNRYDQAISSFQQAVKIKPDYAAAHTQTGFAYTALKLFPEAITAFQQSLRFDPNSPNTHLGLGNAYYNNSRWEESIPHYKKATELLPTWATAHLYLGDAYLNTKQYPNAILTYKQSISLDDKLAEAYYGLGISYFNQKNNTLARQQLEKLKLLNPDLANRLSEKIGGTAAAPTPTPKPVPKTAQRIKDEQDVAKMADFGFDGAVVTGVGSIRETPKATGKLLLSVKRGDILSLSNREPSGNFYQVVEEKSGIEGWIDWKSVVVKLTGNTADSGPPLEESRAANVNANPVVNISNLEEKTTLSIRINGTLYKIPPQTTKTLSVPVGKFTYYGWSPGIRPTSGSKTLEKGKQYEWKFKIFRR